MADTSKGNREPVHILCVAWAFLCCLIVYFHGVEIVIWWCEGWTKERKKKIRRYWIERSGEWAVVSARSSNTAQYLKMGNRYNETISEEKILLKQNGYWQLKLKLLSVRKSALCNIHSYSIRILQWTNCIFCQHLCRPVSCWYWPSETEVLQMA